MTPKQKEQYWPALDFQRLRETQELLHQCLQIVGKVRLRTMPWQNHSWHSTFYVSENGFSTGPIPYQGRVFRIDFNFRSHQVELYCSEEKELDIALRTRTVADFYKAVMQGLDQLSIPVSIHARPNEMEPAIPFAENDRTYTYDPEAAADLWRAMRSANEVFWDFRISYLGKVSPVHLFWGAFDLAVTRFSGRSAPLHPGGIPNIPLEVMQEAYSREVSSAGFWPGSADFPEAIFYSYAYPEPEGFREGTVRPDAAFFSDAMGEYLLRYKDVRASEDPAHTLMQFLQSTYELAARLANWDREALELQHYRFSHLAG